MRRDATTFLSRAVLGVAFLGGLLLAGCGATAWQHGVEAAKRKILASRLPHDQGHLRPTALAKPMDLDALNAVEFIDVRHGGTVNLRSYFAEPGREFLLLVFGSQDCATCNAEAARLKEAVLDRQPQWLVDAGRRFEIIGVNTDQAPWTRLSRHINRFPFIRWQDPAAAVMRTYFLPAGVDVKVPLTVMLERSGHIHWRVLPDEANYTRLDDLLRKISTTLGLDAGTTNSPSPASPNPQTPPPDKPPGAAEPPSPPAPGASGTPTPTGPSGPADGSGAKAGLPDGVELAKVAPGRLGLIAATDCHGQRQDIDLLLARPELRWVQISRGDCDGACLANEAELNNLHCGTATASCSALTLVATPTTSASLCPSDLGGTRRLAGGMPFFTVFATLFNWRYERQENQSDGAIIIPPVAGPLLFAFDAGGGLRWASEGEVAPGSLAAVRATTPQVRGTDVNLYSSDRLGSLTPAGRFAFADWRRQARFTVLAAWGAYPVPCASCIAELKHWSAPGQLVDFCAARPGDCQIAALETHLPAGGESLEQYFQKVRRGDGHGWAGMAALGIRVPLVLDPVPDPDGNNYLQRFFEGYMVGLYPQWGQEYRTFIYDQDGKVIRALKSDAPKAGGDDPVVAALKDLLQN